ncbi:Omega-6 fatty acid desaturase, chloroplastic [Tetrabaena socialis]|uniref:Omega-6 fatty acid desaturase, chloroplastic n=1 Tax=Tetrabaena socialis TaxID=47790 RepID=A0A2J8A6P4_9CHLO|nr:Omega-6 fatty acid desaturase, chloroplastic [Tetrabaena socialis]|eukprot:PNH08199.1 Omega-6 fatty acid desaturase, chloroplastic [Tetrabaena socialis]
MAWLPNWKRLRRKVLNELKEIRLFFIDLFFFVLAHCKKFAYESSLPVTRRLLSRRPSPPKAQVKDVRCKRIRLQIDSTYSSPFNVEEFEVEWRPEVDPPAEWTSVGVEFLTHDISWHVPHHVSSKIPWYNLRAATESLRTNWGQYMTECTFNWRMMKNICTECHVYDDKVNYKPFDYKGEETLFAVQRGEGGVEPSAYQDMLAADNVMLPLLLSVTLEKQVKSLAPKFDYWRSLVVGHPEIDTHQIVSDGQATRMLNPGQLDPYQLQNMGLAGPALHLNAMLTLTSLLDCSQVAGASRGASVRVAKPCALRSAAARPRAVQTNAAAAMSIPTALSMPVNDLTDDERVQLAHDLGYHSIGRELPDGVTLTDIVKSMPPSVFELDHGKAWRSVLTSIVAMAGTLYLISISPWYLLPFAWALSGTAFTGFFVVGHDCGHRSFHKNNLVEDIVGHLMFAPLIFPFEPWRIKHNTHHAHTNK